MFICSENNSNAIKATVLAWNVTIAIGAGLAANVITRKLCKTLDTIESSPEFKRKMDEQTDLCKKNIARCKAGVNTIRKNCRDAVKEYKVTLDEAAARAAQKDHDKAIAIAHDVYQECYAGNKESDLSAADKLSILMMNEKKLNDDAVDDDFDFNDRVD